MFKSPYRKLQFEKYCAKNRFLDILTNQFADSTIAMGDWSPSSQSIISRIAVPHKKFAELLKKKNPRISVTDEFNTSQLCNLCNNRVYKFDPESNTFIDTFQYSEYRYCVYCDLVFNRDRNASINIGNMEVYKQLEIQRPSAFTNNGNRK